MFIKDYLIWHYTGAIKDFYFKLQNFILFNLHFFSYKHLFNHWISPILRLREEKFNITSLDSILSFVILNSFTRSLGFVLRSLIIILGLIFLVFTIIIFVSLFVLWLFLPFLLVYLIYLAVII